MRGSEQPDEVIDLDAVGTCNRASYIFERGQWRATCRTCGHQVLHPSRRSAAALFRMHGGEARARATTT